MLRSITTVFCLLFITSAYSQTFQWAKSTNPASFNDYVDAYRTFVDVQGNVYVVGSFAGTVDFDPGPAILNLSTSNFSFDSYVQKFDPNGNLLWAHSFPGSGYSSALGVKTDALGNVYISGYFDSPTDFNPAPGVTLTLPLGFSDAYIVKLTAAGAFQWVKTLGGFNVDISFQAMDMSASEIILGGYFTSQVDFNPGAGVFNIAPTGFADLFVLKLDLNGDFVWAKAFLGTDYGNVQSLVVDNMGDISMAGALTGSMDFDPGPAQNVVSSGNNYDMPFVVKLSSLGNLNWVNSWTTNSSARINSLAIDSQNDIYMCGEFADTLDTDPGVGVNNLIATGMFDAFVAKLMSNGNFAWAGKIGGPMWNLATSIAVNNNTVYVSGMFEDTLDADPGASQFNLVSAGDMDIFISALSTNGQFLQARRLGSMGYESVQHMAVNSINELVATGYYSGTVDFDPSASVFTMSPVNSSENSYLFKWGMCTPSTTNLSAYDCNSYTLNGQTYTATGVYTQTYAGQICDSLVVLNLTIGNNNTVINHVECNSNTYTFNGITYTSPGTYIQPYTNQASCDSNYIINLSFGTPNASTLNATACDFFTLGNNFYFSSGVYSVPFTNASGCDSMVTLNLTINNSTYNYFNVVNCGPYTFNGITYTVSDYYYFYYPSASGCDSIVELDLTILPAVTSTITQTACKSYVFNGQTYTSSGTYTATFTNPNTFCDSIVTLNLTIVNPNTNITQAGATLTSAAAAPATYQWINCATNQPIPGATSQSYTATSNGNYAVIVTINGCSDTSQCRPVTGLSIKESITQIARIYPNPANDKLHVIFADQISNAILQIQNTAGQILHKQELKNATQATIDVQSYASGIYFMHIEEQGRRFIYKFTKD